MLHPQYAKRVGSYGAAGNTACSSGIQIPRLELIMKSITYVIALTLSLASGAAAQVGPYPRVPSQLDRGYGYGYAPQARIWLEQQRDYLRRGDRVRAAFSTSVDAYVAVVHIDPDGRLEFLYPVGPYDSDYVAGGRTYSLPYRGDAMT
jgi:hypothetical protein